jgi:predicted ATP-dependent endonuclease of OLD family
MILKRIIIKNFRALKGNDNIIMFDKSNIIYLIGQNNTGKSSFLHAYEFFVKSKQKATVKDFHNYDETIPVEIEAWFLKEESDDDDTDLAGPTKTRDPNWIDKWVDNDNIVKVKKIWAEADNSFKKFTYKPSEDDWVLNGFGGFDTLLQKYAPTPIFINAIETEASLEKNVNDLINSNFLKTIENTHQFEYESIKKAISDLQNQITGSEAVGNFNDQLNEDFKKVFSNLTLQIKPKDENEINILKAFEKNHSIGVQKDGVSRKEDFTQHGHGIIRQALFNFLKFLGNFTGGSSSYLILFEEPELFLHPKILFNLRNSLYELSETDSFQVLCATHSPAMIDISKPHSSLVRVVKKSDETTKTYQVGEGVFQGTDDKKKFVQMINRFNPHICEVFYADKVILVEGDTETIVYRELLEKFFAEKEIYVLNTGSKNNIPFFQDFLTHFRIEHYIIHDSDKELNKLKNRSSAWTLNEKIWDKVEEANRMQTGLARRYVHINNFEIAHGYTFDSRKGKPLAAYEYAKTINVDSDADCLNWLKDIVGNKEILHDQTYIENYLKENM